MREKFFGDWVNGQGEKERAQWVPLLDAAERVQCVRPKDEIGADGVAPLRPAGKSGEVFPDLLESSRSADAVESIGEINFQNELSIAVVA